MDAEADVLRIVDANVNRAREALRVVEDYARFACDDPAAAAQAKSLRHELRRLREACGAESLLEARDVGSDAGRELKTPAELERPDIQAVVAAALARLAEALRSIGEFAKTFALPAAQQAERLRYQAYVLEQLLLLRGPLRRRLAAARLHVLISESLCRLPWREVAEAALRGGAGCLQLREKELDDAVRLERARALRSLTAQYGALLIVNDRPDIARLAGADGVHVGQSDLPVRAARRIGGGRLLVGLSVHTSEQLGAALAEEPDYVAVGAMFASRTKPGVEAIGPALLREAAQRTSLPVIAIGGIDATNAAGLFGAGASGVAVCSAVISSADPERAAREILACAPRPA